MMQNYMNGDWMIAASASVILMLGTIHLTYTFFSKKLLPRVAALEGLMRDVSPRISSQTTMWGAWVGFNASHSMGAILFGLIYLHLSLVIPSVLFGSTFLSCLGLFFLLGWALLGKRYWFNVPYRGVLLSLFLFAVGLAVGLHSQATSKTIF